MEEKLQKAIEHQEARDRYLDMYGKDEAKRIQNESGLDMDISPFDAGDPPVYMKASTITVLNYPTDEEIEKELAEWRLLDQFETCL